MTATPTEEQLRLEQTSIEPDIRIGTAKTRLSTQLQPLLVRVVVDVHLTLPDMVELTFLDASGQVTTDAGLALGTPLSVLAGSPDGGSTTVIEAEVTGIEGTYGDRDWYTVIRGYSVEHRMQRVRRTRTFVNAKDSDVARQLAGDAGLTIDQVDATLQVHPQLAQDNQTDWEFLRARAEEVGYEVGVTGGGFHFRAASHATGSTVALRSGGNLLTFSPRLSSANLVAEVEVRAWDPVNAKAMAARQPIDSAAVTIGAGDAAGAARTFQSSGPPPAAAGPLGPAPSPTAYVVHDRAVTVESNSTRALTDAAQALAGRAASGYAEAEGIALGDGRIGAGTVVDIQRVPRQFCGKWTITRARHVYAPDLGYRLHFTASGQQDRTLLALTSAHGNSRGPARIQGVVGAVVTAIEDPLGLGRVKVALPWLSPDYETDWAPVTQLTAGQNTGTLFLPEPEDQVLVAFEFGDLRRPYVLGALVNSRTGTGALLAPGGSEPGRTAVKSGRPASVIRRGIITPSGNRLVFHDDGPPSGGRPTASQVVLATAQDKISLTLDQVTGELKLVCKNGSPPGRLTIECDGAMEIKTGPSGTLTIDGGSALTLKGKTVQLEGTGPTAIKGKPVQLN